MFLPTEVEKVWLACAIDAEGSIQVQDHEGRRAPQVQLFVYNTNLDFVLNAVRLMGGTHALDHNNGNTFNTVGKKPFYRAQLSDHEKTLPVLKVILPYLIIKRAKAEKAIQLIETYDWEAAKTRKMSGFAKTHWNADWRAANPERI